MCIFMYFWILYYDDAVVMSLLWWDAQVCATFPQVCRQGSAGVSTDTRVRVNAPPFSKESFCHCPTCGVCSEFLSPSFLCLLAHSRGSGSWHHPGPEKTKTPFPLTESCWTKPCWNLAELDRKCPVGLIVCSVCSVCNVLYHRNWNRMPSCGFEPTLPEFACRIQNVNVKAWCKIGHVCLQAGRVSVCWMPPATSAGCRWCICISCKSFIQCCSDGISLILIGYSSLRAMWQCRQG